MQPLTHHEILGWIGPFTRRGHHLDLPASNRLERRVAFKPVSHAAPDAATPALHATLQLECLEDGSFELTRIVTLDGGLQARLEATGADAGELLDWIETVPLLRQVQSGPRYLIAQCHRLESGRGEPADRMILTRATARVGALNGATDNAPPAAVLALTLDVPRLRGTTAGIEMLAPAADELALPHDLLAVLGWPWSRLTRITEGWRSELRLKGRGPDRSRDAEAKFERMVQHLAQVLAESPRQYHDRLLRARWRVAVRRAVPLLVTLLVLAAATALPKLRFAQEPGFRALLFNAPTLLFILIFLLPEVPKIEIPPLPRRPTAAAWRRPQH
jgi:hypothetical protein